MAPSWTAPAINACALVLVQSIFAAYTVLLSSAFHGSTLNAWVFALFRDVLGGGILMCAAVWHVRRRRRRVPDPESVVFWPQREDLGSFVALGFLCVWGQGLYAMAVSLTTSDFATLMQPTQPVVAFVAATLVGLEPFPLHRWQSWVKAGAVAVAVGGAAFVVLQVPGRGVVQRTALFAKLSHLPRCSPSSPQTAASQPQVRTCLWAACTWRCRCRFHACSLCTVGQQQSTPASPRPQVSLGGLYPVFMKPMLRRYDSLVLVAWAYVFGAGFILVSVLTCATSPADWHFVPVSWAAIACERRPSSPARTPTPPHWCCCCCCRQRRVQQRHGLLPHGVVRGRGAGAAVLLPAPASLRPLPQGQRALLARRRVGLLPRAAHRDDPSVVGRAGAGAWGGLAWRGRASLP